MTTTQSTGPQVLTSEELDQVAGGEIPPLRPEEELLALPRFGV